MTYSNASLRKWLVAFALTFSLIFTQTVFAAQPALASANQQDGAAEYKQFLAEKYDVQLSGSITKGQFIEAVAQVFGLEASDDAVTFSDLSAEDALFASAAALYEYGILSGPAIQGDLPLLNSVAVSIAVRTADLKELAYTYPASKVQNALTKLQVDASSLAKHVAQELAVAVDTGLLPAEFYAGFKPGQAASEELVNTLLGKVLTTHGLYKQYIGYLQDDDIFAKLNSAYDVSDIIDAPELQALVNEALEQELITGYNIKDSRYDANFIPSLSLIYGHSNFKHAVQLIGLLRSEGLNAKLQFEPKTSAYLHLAEWGDPGPNVVQIENGNFIAFAKEFDLNFEFATLEDKIAFQDIILTYAKKNENDQEGLIHGSWWQPLYFSETELADYEIITNNLVTDPNSPYEIHPFSLNEDSERVIEGFKAINPDAVITPYQFWVDVPFFNYLHGESK